MSSEKRGATLRPLFSVGVFSLSDFFAPSIFRQKSASAIALNFVLASANQTGNLTYRSAPTPTGRSHVPVFGVKVRANLIRTIFSQGNLTQPPSCVLKNRVGYAEAQRTPHTFFKEHP
jgi:hypothetical protein